MNFYEVTLGIGSKDSAANDGAVTQLQYYLNAISQRENRPDFYVGNEDGVFGPNTQKAVRNFQAALGLSVTGVITPDNWYALDAVLTSRGEIQFYTSVMGGQIQVPPQQTQSQPSSGTTIQDLLTTPAGGFNWKLIGIVAAVVIGFMFISEPENKRRRK